MSKLTKKPGRPVPAPKPTEAGARSRAYRLRARVRRGDAIEAEEIAWLSDYEKRARAAGSEAFGASRSGRKIEFKLDEAHEAIGTGAAAEVAAAAALAREEGKRLDSILTVGVDALKEACLVYKGMLKGLIERQEALDEAHLAMLDSVREHYTKRAEAEADLIRKEAESESKGDMTDKLVEQLLPVLMAKMSTKS